MGTRRRVRDLKERRAVTAIEYAVIAGIIAVAIAAAMPWMFSSVLAPISTLTEIVSSSS